MHPTQSQLWKRASMSFVKNRWQWIWSKLTWWFRQQRVITSTYSFTRTTDFRPSSLTCKKLSILECLVICTIFETIIVTLLVGMIGKPWPKMVEECWTINVPTIWIWSCSSWVGKLKWLWEIYNKLLPVAMLKTMLKLFWKLTTVVRLIWKLPVLKILRLSYQLGFCVEPQVH